MAKVDRIARVGKAWSNTIANPKDLTELEVFRKGMKAMGKAMKRPGTRVKTFKDGGSVESYMKRNDGGMAQKTRMF